MNQPKQDGCFRVFVPKQGGCFGEKSHFKHNQAVPADFTQWGFLKGEICEFSSLSAKREFTSRAAPLNRKEFPLQREFLALAFDPRKALY